VDFSDPDSKLGVLRWLETVSIPEVDTASLTHQQLLRSMDALMDHRDAVDDVVAGLLRPLVDQDLPLVFYDLTTIGATSLSEQKDDARKYGMAKEALIARQFMLGVVQDAEGLPIYHEVFDGNQAEAPTLLPTFRKVLARFPRIKRLIPSAQERDRDRPGVPPAAQSHPGACAGVLPGVDPAPGAAHALEGQPARGVAGNPAGTAATHPPPNRTDARRSCAARADRTRRAAEGFVRRSGLAAAYAD
jgi:hypothetical protein